jgi:uncharacterized protein (DUF427 family)
MGNTVKSSRIQPGPGQESVWDYPRPPRLEPVTERIRVVFNGETIADTTRALRVLETSHPPVYYIPPEDIRMEYLVTAPGETLCEWKGRALYYSVVMGGRRLNRVAWYYPDPVSQYAALANHVAFYAGPMDACYVGEEQVRPQPGEFYGGWVTGDVVGPFKGEPGSHGW